MVSYMVPLLLCTSIHCEPVVNLKAKFNRANDRHIITEYCESYKQGKCGKSPVSDFSPAIANWYFGYMDAIR